MSENHHIRVAHWPLHARHTFIRSQAGSQSCLQPRACRSGSAELRSKVCTLQCNHTHLSFDRATRRYPSSDVASFAQATPGPLLPFPSTSCLALTAVRKYDTDHWRRRKSPRAQAHQTHLTTPYLVQVAQNPLENRQVKLLRAPLDNYLRPRLPDTLATREKEQGVWNLDGKVNNVY